MSTGLMLAVSGASIAVAAATGRKAPRLWLFLVSVACVAAFAAAAKVLGGSPEWNWRPAFALGGAPIHLRLDGLSALFVAVVAVVGLAGAVYSREYWSDHDKPGSAPWGRLVWASMLASMGLVLLCSDGLHFLIAWELFAICGYFLVTLERDNRDARSAGWVYLTASHAGTLALFAFFVLLALRTGGWDLGPMRGRADLAPLFWLALCGFAVKAGLFPLHIWLPSAHANAPSHSSALMSGAAIKMGVYGILRFSGWLPAPVFSGWTLVALGSASALFGIVFAFGQTDLKRLLAYCSVENIGIIFVGLGGALVSVHEGHPAWGALLIAGALLHVWNHAAFKSLLFLCSGSIVHATGTREMSRLGGLWRAMPWTSGLLAFGAVAVSGLPPLNGFVSEWLVYLGLFQASAGKGAAAWGAVPAAIVLGAAGAVALAAFAKAATITVLGSPRTDDARHAHEAGALMRGPMIALAGCCAFIALFPGLLWPALMRATAAWNPELASAAAPAPFASLGPVQAAFALASVAAVVLLAGRARRRGVRRGPTWDCGYAAPTPRIQYSGASFSGIVEGWFGWLLAPQRFTGNPAGALPASAFRARRAPETVLERIVTPAAGLVLVVSEWARRLQHGRLQAYILYLLVGVAVLGLAVLLGVLL